MSFQAMAWAVKQKVGNATGKAILLMLANYADEQGECFPSQERLSEECECSVATVARWVKAFEEMGFLTRQKQYGEGGYRRADRLRICTDLPVTKLPIRELPSTELPNSASILTRHRAGANTIKEPINTLSSVTAKKLFGEFWSLYPNKVGKPVAEKAFSKALKRSPHETIMTGLRRYVAKIDDRPWCNPATFLNQDRWDDDPAEVQPRQQATSHPPKPTKITLANMWDNLSVGAESEHEQHCNAGSVLELSVNRGNRRGNEAFEPLAIAGGRER